MPRFIQLSPNRLLNLDTVFEVIYTPPVDRPPAGTIAEITFQSHGGQVSSAYRRRAVTLWGQLLSEIEHPMPPGEPTTGTG